jgi:hypothetical protein
VARPKTRWEQDVKADIRKMKVPNWKTIVQDRAKWKGMVEKTITLRELYRQRRRRIRVTYLFVCFILTTY